MAVNFEQLLARCVNLARDGEERAALRLTIDAEDAAEDEEDLVELNEFRERVRRDMGLVHVDAEDE